MKKGQRAGLRTTTVRRHAHTATPEDRVPPWPWPALICRMHAFAAARPAGRHPAASL